MISGTNLKENLVENVKILNEDYIEIMFNTKFEGAELSEFSEKLRSQPSD